mgnify:CR=1 FL=1
MLTRLLLLAVLAAGAACGGQTDSIEMRAEERVRLPEPGLEGAVSVEAALFARRSIRGYDDSGLSLAEAGQVLWAAYGVTKPMSGVERMRGGYRTAPSAGATYPLEVYLVAAGVEGLTPGLYRYLSESHELEPVAPGDIRPALSRAALGQASVREAPASVVWTAFYVRTTERYGARGRERYVAMDLGHSAQNVYLQAVALGLGTVAVGAFDDAEVSRVLGLAKSEEPLYIMPVGRLPTE